MQPHTDPADAPPVGHSNLLLFLCVANVCRSPAMRFLVEQGLEECGAATAWQFASAGTAVSERQQMCTRSAAHLADLPGGAEFARTHRSRPLDPDLIERAGIILVATRRERSVVARLAPCARGRTFTMIEAALLAGRAASRLKVPATGAEWPAPAALEQMVSAMHLNRGLTPPDELSRPSGGLFSRRRRSDTLDISDVHSDGGRKHHGPVLSDLTWASAQLVDALASISGGPRG